MLIAEWKQPCSKTQLKASGLPELHISPDVMPDVKWPRHQLSAQEWISTINLQVEVGAFLLIIKLHYLCIALLSSNGVLEPNIAFKTVILHSIFEIISLGKTL